MSRRRIPTSFPQWPSHPLWGLLFKKANHFTMTTLIMNIRSDPMATWECAKQFRRPLNFSASVTHAHCILGSSHRSRRCTSAVCLKFGINVMQLELFYILPDSQDPRILEICKKVKGPCHWTIYQELCQLIIRGGQIGPTKNVEITNPKT